MICYFSELRYKEVIDIHTGFRLGYICDVELDDAEGRVVSLITPGRAKLFGLLGREDDYVLPWSCIVKVGIVHGSRVFSSPQPHSSAEASMSTASSSAILFLMAHLRIRVFDSYII